MKIRPNFTDIFITILLLMLPSLNIDAAHRRGKPRMCGKVPYNQDPHKCNTQELDEAFSSDDVGFEVNMLPFNYDKGVWLHVHVTLLNEADSFRSLSIQAQNIYGYPIGVWTTDVPCKLPDTQGQGAEEGNLETRDEVELVDATGAIAETVDCPINYNHKESPSNFLNLLFPPKTNWENIYAAVMLRPSEITNVKSVGSKTTGVGLLFTSIIITQDGTCYMKHHSVLYVISFLEHCEIDEPYNVPVDCHRCMNHVKPAPSNSADPEYPLLDEEKSDLKSILDNPAVPKPMAEPDFPTPYDELIAKYLGKHRPNVTTIATTLGTTTAKPPPTTTSKPPTTTSKPPTTTTGKPTTTTIKPPATTTSKPPTTTAGKPPTTTAGKPPTTTAGKPTTTAAGKPTRTTTKKPATAITTKEPTTTITTEITTTTPPIPETPFVKITKAPSHRETIPTTKRLTFFWPKTNETGKKPDNKVNTAIEVPEIPKHHMYNECEHTKGCIGQPPGCLLTRSCTSIVSFSEETEKAAFQLFGKSEKYIAMGFSDDQLMGYDSVIECVREAGDVIRAYRSFNLLNRDNHRLRDHSPISRLKGKYENGEIYCEFLYLRKTYVYYGDNFTFDLTNNKYYVLYVEGNLARDGIDGNIGYHSDAVVGSTKLGLLEHFGKSKVQYAFEKIHGLSMIFTWFFVYPIGIFLPRYYKETWSTFYIGQYTWWYLIHLVLMGVTIGLTVLSSFSLSIIIHVWKGDVLEWNFHVVSGFIINGMLLLDILFGFAVVKFNSPFRYYFINFMHGFMGHVTFFLSYALLYDARNFSSGMPCLTTSSIITWMVLVMIIHLSMNYQVCYTDFVQGKSVSRVYYSCGTLDLPDQSNKDSPGGLCRKVLMFGFIVVCAIFTVALLSIYSQENNLDCKEESRVITAAEAQAGKKSLKKGFF